MIAWLKRAWTAVSSWVKRSWSWLRWIVAALAAVLIWRRIRVHVARLVDWVSKPASWSKIPGVKTHVVAKNPETGKPETVELPAGVSADDVAAVGISETTGAYHVETLHEPRDRRAMLRGDK